VPAYFIEKIDIPMSSKYWNQLEPAAQVLDWKPERAVTLFGRISKVRSDIYVTLPEWQVLMADPTPQKAAQGGFSYIYMDDQWWDDLSPAQRETYQQPCVRLVDEVRYSKDGKDFRRLYDIQSCQ
jgi:sensor domain CHASE-containing protein